MEKEVAAVKKKNQELNETLQILRQELDNKSKENDSLWATIRELETDLESFQTQMRENLSITQKQFDQQLKAKDMKEMQLTIEIEKLHQENKNLKGQISDLTLSMQEEKNKALVFKKDLELSKSLQQSNFKSTLAANEIMEKTIKS